jgi:DNA-binding NarL/FixJ family response regulator
VEYQPRSILLVEDDKGACEALCSLLTLQFPHAQIHSAEDGKNGLEHFRRHLPDIVITDINMPELDGARMLDEICSIKPETRIIVVTAHSERQILDRIVSRGVSLEIIHKPVDLAALFASLRRCVDLPPGIS